MKLRDKIVAKIWNNMAHVNSHDNAVIAADAILSVIAESVVPLQWVESEGNYKGQTIWCYDDNQTMWIVHNEKDGDYVWCECITMEFAPVSPVRGVFSTLEAAKAAAQADYTRRILSGIGLIDHTDTPS